MKQHFIKKQTHRSRAMCLIALAKYTVQTVLLITMTGSLAACQSTPKTPPVVNKQQGIDQKVENNTQRTNLLKGLPLTVKETVVIGGITLNIDTEIQVPQNPDISVANVQPERFTQDTVDKIVKSLMQGKQLYDPSYEQSKQYLQKLYILRQASLLPSNSGEGVDSIISAAGAKAVSPDLKELQEYIDKTPETSKKVPNAGKLTDVNESDLVTDGKTYKGFHGQSLYVETDLGTGSDASLKVITSVSAKSCNIQFTNHDITHIYKYKYLEQVVNARGMKTTLDQAEKVAQDTLNDLGASDLVLSGVQMGTRIPLTQNDDPNKTDQAYGLWFTRNVNGITTTLDLTDTHLEDAETYHYERVFMLIDDTGVIKFNWYSPMKQTGTISSNAKILSFDDIINTFKKQFPIHYTQTGSNKNSTYTISRITLGMMRVQIKDQVDQYMMIPVWDFFGTTESTDHTSQSFLTINAIDGSVIDRTLGY